MHHNPASDQAEPLAVAVALQTQLLELIREYLLHIESPLSAQDAERLNELLICSQKHYYAIKERYKSLMLQR